VSDQKKPVNLWLWGAVAFGLFIAGTWVWSWLVPEPPPKPYSPPAAVTTERARAIDCDDPFMDPMEWDFYCGGSGGAIDPEPQDGPIHRYG
jgi:hypothetical protein